MANYPNPPGINPRDKRPGDRRALGSTGRQGGTWWYVAGFLMLMALAQVWYLQPAGKTISYSDFKQAVRAGRVAEVNVGEQTIRGTFKGDGSEKFNTNRIEDPKLLEELDSTSVKYTGEFVSRWLPEILSWIIPLLLLFAIWSFFFRRIGGAEGGVMSFARSKHRVFAEDDVKVSFADVAGVDEAEQELKEIVEFLKNPKKYTTLGGRIPKGVLLVGPPGTGKTLLARAVAGEAKVPFFSLSGSEFVEMFVGVGAARVRDLFSQAEQKAPCIIFIDELDALGRARVQSPMGSHEEREQTLNQLLAEMDGFEPNTGVVLIGATNRPEILDAALLRPGRFDRQVVVDRPDVKGREEILRIHARKVKVAPDVDFVRLAKQTPGLVGADLANIINEAALLAGRRRKDAVTQTELEEAIQRSLVGLERKSRIMGAHEKERVAVYETGHALVTLAVPHADPVSRVSIIARGVGALGYTMQVPEEDRHIHTHAELQDRLAVLLGGRGAELIIYADTSTGAADDLARAGDLARRMVLEFGMSELLGPVNLAGVRRQRFLGVDGDTGREYSDQTAREVDEEVRRLVRDAESRVNDLLRAREPALRGIAARLVQTEVILADELKALAREHGAPPVETPAPVLQVTARNGERPA